MKTTKKYTYSGITIPAGSDAIDAESCAVVVLYDESKGCSFDPKARAKAGSMRPRHGLGIAVPRYYVGETE